MKPVLSTARRLSLHALLWAVGTTAALAATRTDVVVGTIRASSASAVPVTVLDPLSGSKATLQFAATSTCFGLACTVDGPAVGAYSMGTTGMSALLVYGFSLVGPTPATAPLLVSGIYSNVAPIVAGGMTQSVLYTSVYQGASSGLFVSNCYDAADRFGELPPASNCGTGSYAFDVLASTSGSVTVELFALIQPHGNAAANQISAFIDPFIQIDPVWLAAHPGYSLVFDAGVSNVAAAVSAVPEPATVALLGLGLAALGARRRKRAA